MWDEIEFDIKLKNIWVFILVSCRNVIVMEKKFFFFEDVSVYIICANFIQAEDENKIEKCLLLRHLIKLRYFYRTYRRTTQLPTVYTCVKFKFMSHKRSF